MAEDEVKVSKYNSGVAIILRLDGLWKDTHKHSRAGFFYKWNQDLDRIWVELARDLDDSEYNDKRDGDNVVKEGYKTKFDSFDKRLSDLKVPLKDTLSNDFENPSETDMEVRSKQYKILMEKELFLRRLENKVGKGTAWSEEEDWE